MAVKNKSNEIKIIRIYDAPVEAVWDAWTDLKQVEKWWGPRGFTITTHSKDLRPGGTWVYTMHGPDGTDWPNTTHYFEVEKHKKLVYDHGGSEDTPPLFRVTVLFSPSGKKTKMEMTMALESPEKAEETRQFIKKANGNSTWDRLAEYLEKEINGNEKFVINRTFNVPLKLMFEMWTDKKQLSQWVPPTGFTMEFLEGDIKAGDGTFYRMDGPGGSKMYGRTKYLEIKKPDLIVYEQQFADEEGKVSRHPMAPSWPETMRTTVMFFEEGPDETRVTLTWEPTGNVTAEELATFVKARAGMMQGWTGSFDKLDNFLPVS